MTVPTAAAPGSVPAPGTPRLWPLLSTLRSRLGFRFSPGGGSAAALVADGRGFLFCEYWSLAGDAPGCRVVPGFRLAARAGDDPAALPAEAVPFDDGSVLITGRNELRFVSPGGDTWVADGLPFRPQTTAPAPDGRHHVLFTGQEDSGAWSAWYWAAAEKGARKVAELAGPALRGGGWLDTGATRYVFNALPAGGARDGAASVPMVLDLAGGGVTPLPIASPSAHDLAWHTAPRTGRVLMAGGQGDERWLWIAGPDGARRLRAPERLDGSVSPLAMHPDGDLVALVSARGLVQRLVALDVRTDTVVPLPTPDGTAVGGGAWSDGAPDAAPRMWVLSVSPGRSPRIMSTAAAGPGAGPAPAPLREVTDGTAAGSYDAWAPSRLERLPGADGREIEVIVCGHEDWRTARRIVVCLHGGPVEQWSLKFSLLFQIFADHGLTVLAPNQAGSTGYGEAFHR